jgi:hypothetical protein
VTTSVKVPPTGARAGPASSAAIVNRPTAPLKSAGLSASGRGAISSSNAGASSSASRGSTATRSPKKSSAKRAAQPKRSVVAGTATGPGRENAKRRASMNVANRSPSRATSPPGCRRASAWFTTAVAAAAAPSPAGAARGSPPGSASSQGASTCTGTSSVWRNVWIRWSRRNAGSMPTRRTRSTASPA